MNTHHSPITQSDTPGDPTCHSNLPFQPHFFISSSPFGLRKQLAPFDVWLSSDWIIFTAASDRVSIHPLLRVPKSFSIQHHAPNPNHRLPLLFPNTLKLISLCWRSKLLKFSSCLEHWVPIFVSAKRTRGFSAAHSNWLKGNTPSLLHLSGSNFIVFSLSSLSYRPATAAVEECESSFKKQTHRSV